MKKLFSFNYFIINFLIMTFLLVNSCKKDTNNEVKNSDVLLIEDAKTTFEQQINSTSNYTLYNQYNTNVDYRKSLGKKPDWNNARIKKTTLGNAVLVPITFDKKIYLKLGENTSPLALKDITYLFIYTNKKQRKIIEWVTFIPDYTAYNINEDKKFVGKMIVEDWYGNFKKGFYFNNNGVAFKIKTNTETNSTGLKVDANGIKSNRTYCSNVPWYQEVFAFGSSYYSIGGYDLQCYIVESDPFNTDNTPTNEDAGGDTSPTDYYSYTAYNNVDTDSLSTDAKCIYDRLMQNNYFVSLITQFQNNANLNLTFKMGNIPYFNGQPLSGKTHHFPNTTNFSITIDNSLFNQVYAIEAATTFLHEAFHANLWLQAQLWYPNDLPSNFQNMSLIEQFKYIEDRSGNGFINSAQHNYIATKIDNIANALLAYTQANYPSIYNNPTVTFDAYRAMAYRGLEGTQYFSTYVNSLPNGSTSYINSYIKLVNYIAVNKCP